MLLDGTFEKYSTNFMLSAEAKQKADGQTQPPGGDQPSACKETLPIPPSSLFGFLGV